MEHTPFDSDSWWEDTSTGKAEAAMRHDAPFSRRGCSVNTDHIPFVRDVTILVPTTYPLNRLANRKSHGLRDRITSKRQSTRRQQMHFGGTSGTRRTAIPRHKGPPLQRTGADQDDETLPCVIVYSVPSIAALVGTCVWMCNDVSVQECSTSCSPAEGGPRYQKRL